MSTENKTKWTDKDTERRNELHGKLRDKNISEEDYADVMQELDALEDRLPRSLALDDMMKEWKAAAEAEFGIPAWQLIHLRPVKFENGLDEPRLFHFREGYDTEEEAKAAIYEKAHNKTLREYLVMGDGEDDLDITNRYLIRQTTEEDWSYWYQEFVASQAAAFATALLQTGIADGFLKPGHIHMGVFNLLASSCTHTWLLSLKQAHKQPED